MAPVVELTKRPVGRPVAEEVRVAVDDVSLEVGVNDVMAVPETLDFGPGLVTATVLVMVQVRLTEFE